MEKKVKRTSDWDENILNMQLQIFREVRNAFLAGANTIIDHQQSEHVSSEHDVEVIEQVRQGLNFGLAGLEPDTSDGNWGLPPEKWTGPEDYEAASHGV